MNSKVLEFLKNKTTKWSIFIILLILSVLVIVKYPLKIAGTLADSNVLQLNFSQEIDQQKIISKIEEKYSNVNVEESKAKSLKLDISDWSNEQIDKFEKNIKKDFPKLKSHFYSQNLSIREVITYPDLYKLITIIFVSGTIYIVYALKKTSLKNSELGIWIVSDFILILWELLTVSMLLILLSQNILVLKEWALGYLALLASILAAIKMYVGYSFIDYVGNKVSIDLQKDWQEFLNSFKANLKQLILILVLIVIIPISSLSSDLALSSIVLIFGVAMALFSIFTMRGLILDVLLKLGRFKLKKRKPKK